MLLSGRGLKGLMQPNHSYTMKVVFPQTTIQHKHNPITLAQVLPLHMGQTYLTKKVLWWKDSNKTNSGYVVWWPSYADSA